MLRDEIISAHQQIQNALEKSDAYKIFDDFFQSGPSSEKIKETARKGLPVFQKLMVYHYNFSQDTKTLLDIWNLSPVFEDAFWANVLWTEDTHLGRLYETYSSLNFFREQGKKIVELLRHQSDHGKTARGGKHEVEPVELVTFIFPDTDSTTEPAQIVCLFDALDRLQQVLSRLENLPAQSLIVESCDSGSDKQFKISGMNAVIMEIYHFLSEFVRRSVFYRELSALSRIEAVAKSLPILERINDKVKSSDLSTEEGEILRREILLVCTNFSKSGAIVPSLDNTLKIDQRELVHDRPSLLQYEKVSEKD